MTNIYEIRANYNRESIVIYQAYSSLIAEPAIANQKFVPPFSLNRMTWIKPSFLWLMHRSNWAQKSGQENILAVHISKNGWEKALSLGVLTHPEKTIYSNSSVWESKFKSAKVHIQWDPERNLRGSPLNIYSIQVGLSRQIIEEYVNNWVLKIENITPLVAKIRKHLNEGNEKNAKKLLPEENIYRLKPEIGKNIQIN